MMERESLVNKKDKTNSSVWKYFGFKESSMEKQQILEICFLLLLGHDGGPAFNFPWTLVNIIY